MTPRWSELRIGFLLLGAASLVAMTAAEVSIRVLSLAPQVTRLEIDRPNGSFVLSENPILKYVPNANSGDINAYGVRDRPFAIEKPRGRYRIVVLGDSIGFGFCNDNAALPIESTFPKVLEKNLRERRITGSSSIDVINLSVSGYDTEQEVEFLREKGLALDPDLVIVAYCLNDAWESSTELEDIADRNWEPLIGRAEWVRRIYLSSHLFRMILHRAPLLGGASGPEYAFARGRTKRGFRALARLAEERGFETVIVTFPIFESFATYSRLREHRRVAAWSAENGFRHHDLLPAFRRVSAGDPRLLQGRCNREHPNEIGHRVAAESIEDFLLSENVILAGHASPP